MLHVVQSWVIQIEVLSQRSDEFVPLKQNWTLFKARPSLLEPNRVDEMGIDLWPERDQVICFQVYSVLKVEREPIYANWNYSHDYD